MECVYYQRYDEFKIAVDCIIFGFDKEDGLKLLLTKRFFEPCKGGWSLMGGFLCKNENLAEAASRVLYDCTGLREVYMEQLNTYGRVDRDPGGRVVSTAYYALLNIQQYEQQFDSEHAVWVKMTELPTLIFDHSEMVQDALSRLRHRASNYLVGLDLLPKEFTLPTLQLLYESIFGYSMDKRNFRKKIMEMEFLDSTGRKDYANSRKGAFLYSFNQDKYKEIVEKGYNATIFPKKIMQGE